MKVIQSPKKLHTSPWLVQLSWLEHHPVDQEVVSLIPGQGMYEKAANQYFSLTLTLPLSLKSNEKNGLG